MSCNWCKLGSRCKQAAWSTQYLYGESQPGAGSMDLQRESEETLKWAGRAASGQASWHAEEVQPGQEAWIVVSVQGAEGS